MQSRRHGFTLIELLVVIAIIAILAAILFPVFAQAREKARAISCLSNMKQMGNAFLMYTQDYDEKFPGWSVSTGPIWESGCRGSWRTMWFHHAWYPYVKNWSVFICPSTRWETGKNCGFFPDEFKPYGTSYAFSCAAIGCLCKDKTMAQLKKPAELLMLSDGNWACMRNFIGPPGPVIKGDETSVGCGTGWIEPHSGGVNVAYFDGHAKWMKSDRFFAPDRATYASYLPWANVDNYPPGW